MGGNNLPNPKNQKQMKKLIYCAAALATLLFASSCQRENLEPAQESTAVTFTVEAPAALQTKEIADGLNVNQLIYEVWLTDELGTLTSNAQKLYQAETTMAEENGVNKATLTLDLVNDQKFTVLFWAQVKEEGAYDTKELTAVTYAKSEYDSNNESLAAFYAVAYVNDSKHVEKDGTTQADSKVSLRRPFAQLNLGTLNTSTAYKVEMVSSEVKVTSANTVFNVATSVASNSGVLTFKNAAVPSDPATLSVNGTVYQYAAMNYLFAGDNATVEYDIVTKLNGNMEGTVNNTVSSVPLKENYRTNIIGNLLTSKTDYEIVVDAEFNTPDEIVVEGVDYVTTDLELNEALKQDKRDIVIDLAQEEVTRATSPKTYNVDVTSWKTLAFGSELTKSITINANGNTINFNLLDGDWSHVSLNNDDAVLTINDANITTSGENTDHWKRVILHFASDVVLNNVTAANGLGFKKDAYLNDVEVSQVGDNYALWVWAQGQTVTLDGVSVDSPGRALKVADEDATGPAKVTVSVSNSTFKSVEKAAILVTSKAGAVINWGKGNDITGVAADPINAVWVDEDRAQYASEVKVDGASVILEGSANIVTVKTAEELQKAADEATKITMIAIAKDIEGDVTVAQKPDVKIVINGGDHSYKGVITVDGKSAAYPTAGLTIKDLTFDAPTISADACVRLGDTNDMRYTSNVTVDNCIFDVSGAVGVKSYTGGDKNLIITGCTATANAHSLVQAKGIDGILAEKCVVLSKNGLNFNNSDNVTVDNCTVDVKGYAVRFGESSGGVGAAETYAIKNSTLKSACEDGDAVVILRGTADYATLTIEKTTLEGSIQLTNTAKDATVIIDGKAQKVASDQSSLDSALTGDSEVTLGAGDYNLPSVGGGDVAINGTEYVVITIDKPNYSGSDLTLNGVTVKGLGYSTGVQHVNTVTYNDVKVIGEMCLYGEKVVFNGCTFELALDQYIWTYGAKEVEFIGCTFNTAGKAILVYNEGAGASKVTVNGCTFNATASAKAGAIANQNCAAIEIDNFQSSGNGAAHVVITEGNTYGNNFSGEWRIKNFVAGNPVTVNGTEYTQIAIDGKLMTIDASKNVTVL